MPSVSVLIPAYNAAAFVGQAVRSALAQRDVDAEVLVVDDGSTDGTWDVLASFGDAIRALRQPNAGHVAARNAAAAVARGEWLAFLDADDEWLPDKLAKQLAAADADTGLVYTDRANFGDCAHVGEVHSEKVDYFEGDVFEPLLLLNFITLSSVILRKSWYERLGGFAADLRGVEDWDLWLRFAAAGGQVRVCREPLTRYRWHAASMTTNQEGMCHGRVETVRRALATPRGRQVPRALARQALASAWECSAWHAAASHRWQALGWYARAAWYWPWKATVYKEMVKCCLARP